MGSRRIKSQSTATHGRGVSRAFTLIELLVVIAIISLLASIVLPVAAKARRKVKHIINKNNMRQITIAMKLYGAVNNDKCPPTLGEIRTPSGLTGSDPRYVIVPDGITPNRYRTQYEYLGPYVTDAEIMFCCNAPKYPDAELRWEARSNLDSFTGSFVFLNNYTGYLPQSGEHFR